MSGTETGSQEGGWSSRVLPLSRAGTARTLAPPDIKSIAKRQECGLILALVPLTSPWTGERPMSESESLRV
eukprot:38181-Rhodomonas_salina.2